MFGNLKEFMVIEIIVFFIHLFTMSLWLIRARLGQNSNYLTEKFFTNNSYREILKILHQKIKAYLSDDHPLTVYLENKTLEIKLNNNKYNITVYPQKLSDFDMDVSNPKTNISDMVEQWTGMKTESIERYRILSLNTIDMTELAPHKYQTFTLLATQLFSCIVIIYCEELIFLSGINVFVLI